MQIADTSKISLDTFGNKIFYQRLADYRVTFIHNLKFLFQVDHQTQSVLFLHTYPIYLCTKRELFVRKISLSLVLY